MQADRTLEEELAEQRRIAAVLRQTKHTAEADRIDECCAGIAGATERYLRWLTEDDAMLQSGRTKEWLRKQYPQWEANGDARKEASKRMYRMMVVPVRSHLQSAREAGRRAGKTAI